MTQSQAILGAENSINQSTLHLNLHQNYMGELSRMKILEPYPRSAKLKPLGSGPRNWHLTGTQLSLGTQDFESH